MVLAPRVVLVHRRSELELLVDQHGTRGAVEFFLRTRGRTLAQVQERHDAQHHALGVVAAAVPTDWRRGTVVREDLPRFDFEPEDVVVAVGQDGLVANLARYLRHSQPVVGIDPEPGRNPGILVRHEPQEGGRLVRSAAGGTAPLLRLTMVEARLDDGQQVTALNEVYIGHASHQSARYRLTVGPDQPERQSSSGLLVATGTGATGWVASISHDRHDPVPLPGPTDPTLAWYVREAWPSPSTGTTLTAGLLAPGTALNLTVESPELVLFGDGQERDHVTATWGQDVTVTTAQQALSLVA